MIPSNMVLPCRGVRKTTEDINIRTKAAKMNQKEPMSNIVPNKDTWELPEKREERRKTRTMPSPEARRADLGKIIFPSENRAMAQKITESASPATKSSPLEVSTGILVKGKEKIGNKTTTRNSDKNASPSNIFVFI